MWRASRQSLSFLPALWLLFVLLIISSGQSEPLLFVGKADAALSGGFSYDFLNSPLRKVTHSGEARFRVNLPINISAPLHEYIGDVADSLVVVPEFFASAYQRLNGHFDVSAPLWGGTVFFAARENASLNVTGAMGNTYFNLDTLLEGAGSIVLKGSIHMPLLLDVYWRSLTFGYTFQPSPYIRLGFQVHKHLFGARVAGDLRPDMAGRIDIVNEHANTSLPVEYPSDKVYGFASGNYEGKAWSPEVGISIGPFSLVSRMGVHMAARGSMLAEYSVPFFIDEDNFEPRFAEPDSFLVAHNLKRVLASEVNHKAIRIDDRLILNMPQSHTLGLELLDGRITISFTKVFGKLSFSTLGAGGDDSTRLETGDYLDAALIPDNIVCLGMHLGGLTVVTGMHTLNLDYRQEKSLLSDILPLEINGDPLVPLLHFGFTWGTFIRPSVQFHILPLPAVRTGVGYAF